MATKNEYAWQHVNGDWVQVPTKAAAEDMADDVQSTGLTASRKAGSNDKWEENAS